MAISVVHTTASNTLTTTIPSTTAGNCLVVCVMPFNVSAGESVSGVTLGGSADNFTQAVTSGTAGSPAAIIWVDPNCAGGQTSVVISGTNLQVDSGNGGVVIYEVSGLAASSVVDKTNSSTGTGASWTSNATATTTVANEFWVGCVNGVSLTGPSSPWTNTAPTGGFSIAGQQIVSSTGAATYSGTGGGGWAAAVATLKGASSGTSGTVQSRATVPVPRRKPRRGQWQQITGQAFVKVPAPVQQPKPAPRRKLARALVRFVPVITVNAIPPNGTVQPQTAVPAPRRKLARALSRGIAVPGTYATAPVQEYRTPPRRKLARALVRFVPVTTTNPPRQLLLVLASQAGTDDYGNTYGQGVTSYGGGTSANLNSGVLQFLQAPTQVGPAQVVPLAEGILGLTSGQVGGGDNAAEIELISSQANSGQSELAVVANQVQLNLSAALTIPISGVSSSVVNVPHNPNDPTYGGGGGSSWLSGERLVLDNQIDKINSNFTAIVNALKNAGIIT